jgi:DNA anti-recombination protein RmuC/gas vesicle protein
MVGEMTFGLAVGGFFGFVLGIIIGAWLRKAPSVERLSETITDLHRRLDELQKTTATQKQVERVQNDLSNAQQTLAQVDRSLQNLVSFSQTSLQPQISQQLQNALDALSRVQQALQDAYQSLTTQHQSSEQRHKQLMDNLQMARDVLAQSQTLLGEVNEKLDSGQKQLDTKLSQLQEVTSNALSRVQQALQDAYQSLTAQHQSSEQRHQQLMDNLQMASKMLASSETLLREVSETLRSGQERLETELNQLRKDLAVAKENVQRINEQVGILTVLQQTAERVEENIKKVVETLTGRRSGQAGEQVVGKLLSAVPDDWLERNIRLGSGQVEFAIKMPGGYLIPLDSKFISPELIAQSESDGGEQMRRRVRDEVRRRAQEVAKYLTDHRVLGFGIAAVPDSVYDLCRDAVKAAAHDRIVVVPYSLLLPFVLSLYLMAQRLGISRLGETDQAIGTAITALEQARQALENMAQQITAVNNQRQKALQQIRETINSFRRLTHGEIALPDTATQPTLEILQQAPEETSPSAPEA